MFPLPCVRRFGKRAGFTLIELLIVITIIAVLASILLSVFGAVQNRARKVQAVNDLRNINIAIISYYGDYHHYPLNVTQQTAAPGSGDTVYGDPNGVYSSANLFDILRAIPDSNNLNNAANPSQNVYWAGKFAASATMPREGLTTQDVTTVSGVTIPKGSLVDPWGNSYLVYIDADLNGDLSQIVSDHHYSDAGTIKASSPPLGVAFACLGPDGQYGTKGNGISKNSDDIVSWLQ